MAPTEKRSCRGSGETTGSPHAACHPSPCTEHLHDTLEEVEVGELDPHGQPARMVTDPGQVAWHALDLKFPREQSESDWSDWSEGDGRVIEGEEKDCPGNEVVDSDDDDDNCNGQLVYKDKKPNTKIICPGKLYPESEAEEIEQEWIERYCKQMGEYSKLFDDILAREHHDDSTTLPPFPMKLLPPTTSLCFMEGYCYHSVYKTHDTSTTPSTLGYRTPQQMLQFFSMRLPSSGLSYPISVYGILAVRDDLDQRRNYLFNCPRDTAVEIVNQESFDLPLCSPCRGIYVLDEALLEVDLWVKKEGNGSADKHILSAYAEIEVRANFDIMLGGRIPGVDCNLDLKYMIIARSIEAVVQVYAEVDHPHHVKFTALSTGYDDEIVLFDDKISGSVKLFQHIVAVKRNENLDVLLRVDESLFQWTFHDEYVGPVSSPDDSILQYGQFFVRVLFAPKNSA
ncbi:uncharacterized protein LOC119275459 [Triticum dicoccoides]|uniref:uncharacterized protein LOC119275459 n=1 Tax=Triticum dicoccoides TaxID=85692 RepID=UPI00188E112F|nr:uncharacterized protein LOC119275459 [Triticum dicoccoides]XP_037412206.1 uncharacterized protein LOC119275459 [Triticum dicoccoides]